MAKDYEAMRAQAAQLMRSRQKKNSYTQGAKRTYFFGYPDNIVGNTTQAGFSDCSAAVAAAIRAVAGINIGSNTNAQIKNRANGAIVDQTNGCYPNENNLLPGDCLYFKGNSGHALDVGHVEMYIGNGKCAGHGSGTGPTIKDVRAYCASRASKSRRYFMAIRWITGGEGSGAEIAGTLGERLLKRGCAGIDVRELQAQLIALGYALPAYGTDGEYGAETEAAVKAFQRDHKLEADGEYGPLTHAALMEAVSAAEGETDEEETPGAPESGEPAVVITGGSVNARKGPATGYGVLTIVHAGERYAHIATARNGWHCIAVGDGTAWVSNKYAEVVDVEQ